MGSVTMELVVLTMELVAVELELVAVTLLPGWIRMRLQCKVDILIDKATRQWNHELIDGIFIP